MHKSLEYIAGKIEISRDLILLLVIGGLYSLSIFLSNTFVNVYLWKQAGDYATIAFYNLGIYMFQPLTFILAGKMAKKVDRIIVLRLGVVFLSLFFLTVLLVAEQAATYNIMLGSVLGIGFGFYWLAFNVLTFEITEPESRDFFNGLLGVLQSFAGMIGPLLAGSIIAALQDNIGYNAIFAISFILFIGAVVCSFFLKRRRAEGMFRFKYVLQERRYNKNWKGLLNAQISQGFREGIFSFVISILVFIATQSEFALGLFNLLLSGLSFIFYFIVTKWVKPSMRKRAILTGALILYFSVYIIVFNGGYAPLMIYAALIGIAYPIVNVPYASLTYDVIGKARKAKNLRVEYIVVSELFLNVGRVAAIAIFLTAISVFKTEQIMPYLLAVFGLGHLFMYGFIKNITLDQADKNKSMTQEPVTDEKNR